MEEIKKIAIDYDGTLNDYESGYQSATFTPDKPVKGAIEFIRSILKDTEFKLVIFSARNCHEGGIDAIKGWLKKFGLTDDEINEIQFDKEKHGYWLLIDDRVFCFKGIFPSIKEIKDFKPWWNKKEESRASKFIKIIEG